MLQSAEAVLNKISNDAIAIMIFREIFRIMINRMIGCLKAMMH